MNYLTTSNYPRHSLTTAMASGSKGPSNCSGASGSSSSSCSGANENKRTRQEIESDLNNAKRNLSILKQHLKEAEETRQNSKMTAEQRKLFDSCVNDLKKQIDDNRNWIMELEKELNELKD